MKLIHDSGKHNKFWSYTIDEDNNVMVKWGRLGTKGQSKTHKFYSLWEAQNFADKKVREKQRKGYKEMDQEGFELKQLQAEIVGAGCKIQDLAFVEKCIAHGVNGYRVVTGNALANPAYEPLIYCRLLLTGKRGARHLLIDPEKVYSCWQQGSLQTLPAKGEGDYYILKDIAEITDKADDELKKIREKAPAIVSALIR